VCMCMYVCVYGGVCACVGVSIYECIYFDNSLFDSVSRRKICLKFSTCIIVDMLTPWLHIPARQAPSSHRFTSDSKWSKFGCGMLKLNRVKL